MDAGSIIAFAAAAGRDFLFEDEAGAVLAAAGIAVAPCRTVRSEREAVQAAEEIGYPVVLKVRSALIRHKSDLGGVALDLQDAGAVERAYREILSRAAAVDREAAVNVQPMAPPGGVEVIVGLLTDPQFGPVLMFGLGGIFTEVLNDVCFRMVPVTADDVREMIASIRGARLLDGYRGRPAADRRALEELMLAVSDLASAHPEIKEMDLNPVVVYAHGLQVLDVRVSLHRGARPDGGFSLR